jgi:hypothetical protein
LGQFCYTTENDEVKLIWEEKYYFSDNLSSAMIFDWSIKWNYEKTGKTVSLNMKSSLNW